MTERCEVAGCHRPGTEAMIFSVPDPPFLRMARLCDEHAAEFETEVVPAPPRES